MEPNDRRQRAWRNLERSETSSGEQASYKDKVVQIASAQRAGRVDAGLPAAQVLALVLASVQSWALASAALRTAASARDATRAARRRSVREATMRLTTPLA